MMQMILDDNSLADYATFLRIKSLPSYRVRGCFVEFPDEYAHLITNDAVTSAATDYGPSAHLYDYQVGISQLAIARRKYAVFADCGLGKTFIAAEFVRHAIDRLPEPKRALIVSPLMVITQTIEELGGMYGDKLPIEQVSAADLSAWMTGDVGDCRIGITNYEALKAETPRGNVGCLVLDESSMLKSHYGRWASECLRLGQGVEWKLCLTGTPAPNDRIEYANHAVFLDACRSVNEFLARFFVNKGQTGERWVLKPHGLRPFYTALSHFSFFLTNPATYGWKDNASTLPPIIVNKHQIEMTREQQLFIQEHRGELFVGEPGGITGRSALGQIGKGFYKDKTFPSHKPEFIRKLVESFNGESTIIWCIYNKEQEILAEVFGSAAMSMTGATPLAERVEMIRRFKARECNILISKPRILGFGLNLQVCTRQIFSGLQDSYEAYYQAVKRSNRVGSTHPLHVHIPYTDVEAPMIDSVLRKAERVEQDTREQEELFANVASRQAI